MTKFFQVLSTMAQATLRALNTATDWVRRHILWILAFAVAGATAAAVIRRKTNRVNTISDAIQVQNAKVEIIKLRKKMEAIEATDQQKADQVLKLDGAITEQKKLIGEAVTGKPWEQLTDDEVRASLREAGL